MAFRSVRASSVKGLEIFWKITNVYAAGIIN